MIGPIRSARSYYLSWAMNTVEDLRTLVEAEARRTQDKR
jgi:hypothetical protein